MSLPLADLTLARAADSIRRRDVTAVAVTEAVLARAAAVQPEINCFLRVHREEALAAAERADAEIAGGRWRGPLHGVPLAHKDVFDREGHVTTAGGILFDAPATGRATVMSRLDAAGATYLGALNLDEFAAGGTGANDHYGRTRNPWNTDHVSGGSSGGSGACVAARAAFGALGGDAGGSVRIPAAMCGVVGLKPTFGRVSRAGTAPRTFSVDCTGPMTRTAEDCALMLQAIAGPDPADPTTPDVPVPDYRTALRTDLAGVRVGVAVGDPFDRVEPELAALLASAVDALRDLGAEVVDVAVPDVTLFNDLQQILTKSEAAVVCGKWMRERPEDMTFDAISVVQEGLLMPATRYLEAKSLRAPLLEAHVRAVYVEVDVLFTPVLAGPTPTVAETDFEDCDRVEELFTRSARFTRFANYLGTPALSVPCGFSADGLPAAFQLHGPPFGEARLLAVAHAYQGVTDHHAKAPGFPSKGRMEGDRGLEPRTR